MIVLILTHTYIHTISLICVCTIIRRAVLDTRARHESRPQNPERHGKWFTETRMRAHELRLWLLLWICISLSCTKSHQEMAGRLDAWSWSPCTGQLSKFQHVLVVCTCVCVCLCVSRGVCMYCVHGCAMYVLHACMCCVCMGVWMYLLSMCLCVCVYM